MTDLKIINGELIRLVYRECEYDATLVKKVIAACKQNNLDSQDQIVLARLKADVEMMENRPVTTEVLIERVGIAEPVDYVEV